MTKQSSLIKIIYISAFFALTVILGISAFYNYYNAHYINKPIVYEYANVTPVSSFSEHYSFKEEDTFGSLSELYLKTQKTIEKIEWFTNRTGEYLSENNLLNKYSSSLLRRSYTLFEKDVYVFDNSIIVRLPDGCITESFSYCPSTESENSILDFYEWLQDRNTAFLYLIHPDKSDDSVTVFPDGIPHGYSRMHNEFETFLNENKLPFIDAKETLLEENSDFYSWFYKSDHHWNAQAGFIAADKTAEYLNESREIAADTDVLDFDNFNSSVYSSAFCGSYAKILGDQDGEDLTVFCPDFDTCFHIEIPNLGVDRTGSFEDTLIDGKQLTDVISYSAFLFGDRPLIRVENRMSCNGTRVLVLKESFGDVYCTYLANTVQYLDVLDPRSFDGSIRTFIEETNPDIVIICMGIPYAGAEKALELK